MVTATAKGATTIEDLLKRHGAPVPRYTSYPTANHFNASVGPDQHRAWLASLPQGAKLSLYTHVPFCQELCWYCGCSTKAVRRYAPVSSYLDLLVKEIDTVAGLVPGRHAVTHMHWGGGSPDILTASDIARLADRMRERFIFAGNAEVAVEIDPRLLDAPRASSLAEAGFNRVSIGVQDFDPVVQKAIGRMQSFEATARAVRLFREFGVGSINLDLVYGLPHQTTESVARTLRQVLSLDPERIAIFGYAHLPSRLKHQRLIDEAALPGPLERHAQSRRLAAMLGEAGYVAIGIDHFAKATDSLASGAVARNFQGYTTDRADALIGFGASAISRLPAGYAQNAVAVHEYGERLASEGLATARGWRMGDDDRLRALVIEELMCTFGLSTGALVERFGQAAAEPILAEAARIVAEDRDGLVEPTADGFRLTASGQPFVRTVCARFDTYLAGNVAERRHAMAV
ncbi:MAG: oxygen-independent coproporphyrinogen III oxidase [Rhizobiales bacterium]|nr:oxygen-independent coproporphyrinogen III oxidase [Hyphomicrobiales bacterium]